MVTSLGHYMIRHRLACISLIGICLLVACSAKDMDTAKAPADRAHQAATPDDNVNMDNASIARSGERTAVDDAIGGSEPVLPMSADVVNESRAAPQVSGQSETNADRIATRAVKMATKVAAPQMKLDLRVVEPPRATLRSRSMTEAPPAPATVAPMAIGPMAVEPTNTTPNGSGPTTIRPSSVGPMANEPDAPELHAESKPQRSSVLSEDSERDASAAPYREVTVFYATDRKALAANGGKSWGREALLPFTVSAAGTLLLFIISGMGWHRRKTASLAIIGVLVTLSLGVYWTMSTWDQVQQVADPGVRYGNERGTLAYGECTITIPTSHSRGKIERPSILRLEVREDAAKHIVLQATQPAAKDTFFDQLRDTVQSAEHAEVFVFVHGYNVTFDSAARRTAQIAYDVKFTGAPIFFSWPSQGGLLKYTVDQNNVQWAVPHLKEFLIDVTRRSGAKSVNLIAHSMGNRALTAALRELQLQLRQETALFNQIILAAPDVDAEIFRRDLAPALVQSAQRVTLYASSNDQALAASKKVHGYARAGDSGPGLVVLPGIETIDVSTLDTSLLGHSYYGSSNPILLDIHQLIRDALPAAKRPFLLPRPYGRLTYWEFENIPATATRNISHGPQ